MDKKLIDILVCPLCKGTLLLKKHARSAPNKTELVCLFDRLAYPIRDGIPVMLEQEARLLSLEEKDSYEH